MEEKEEGNQYTLQQLNSIRDQIENMPRNNQIAVLKIMMENNKLDAINENKYGIHINLTELDNNLVEKLLKYIMYVNTQEIYLNKVEEETEQYKQYFKEK